MITLDQARKIILSTCRSIGVSEVLVTDSLGFVLAQAPKATLNVPPFDNSAMDGYALRARDVESVPTQLKVVGTRLASGLSGEDNKLFVGPGECMRIMTGAKIPQGTDSVVMIENTLASNDGSSVEILESCALAKNVRRIGDDILEGEVLCKAGTPIGPSQLALLVSGGCAKVQVFDKPKIGVISTGSELVEPGKPLLAGQIYDSNRPMMLALLSEAGFSTIGFSPTGFSPTDLGCVGDNLEQLVELIYDQSCKLDVIIFTGGVSVGDADIVKEAIRIVCQEDAHSMQIAIKPGKPLAFGTLDKPPPPNSQLDKPAPSSDIDDAQANRRTYLFGLPGNPVSAAISFELFVRPALLVMSGHENIFRNTLRARLSTPIQVPTDGKVHFVRVSLERDEQGDWLAISQAKQGSHQLSGLSSSDGIAIIESHEGLSELSHAQVMVTNPTVFG